MRIPRALTVAAIALQLPGHAAPALSQCPTSNLWTYSAPITRVSSDAGFGPGLSFFGLGSTLYAVWSESASGLHQAGAVKWAWSDGSGATIDNFPNPVPLSGPNGGEFLFVATDNGRLHKINALDGTLAVSVDTRRPACASDQVIATPAVQLWQYSNPAFQSHVMGLRGFADDIVFVATRAQCGDASGNRVLAYYASDLVPAWVFNPTGTQMMDYASEAPAIDYDSNTIYCGSHQSGAQSSLWAINSLTGIKKWSRNIGSISSRPLYQDGKLYVASDAGALWSIDPVGGGTIWSTPVPGGIVRNPWPEFRTPANNSIYLTDNSGWAWRIDDLGPTPTVKWGMGPGYVSMPVVAPPSSTAGNKVFLGRNDGTLEQLDAATGAVEAAEAVSQPGTLFDPSLDASAAVTIDRVVIGAGQQIRRYCLPLCSGGCGTQVGVTGPASSPPEDFVLGQNAPNPFGARTQIQYRLPNAGRVEIAVHDAQGGLVRVLLRAEQPAGPHQVEWDGLDRSGRPAPGGVYFCRLRSLDPGSQTLERSKPIVLVR
jgi:outer membrane protein assembly factor BamB